MRIINTKQVGEGCVIHDFVMIHEGAVIGNSCKIQNFVNIVPGVTLEDFVFVGPMVTFTNVKYPKAWEKADGFEKTVLKKGCSIGANSTILCGITIGEFAMVGAGSVVTKDVPAYTLVMGNPARVVRKITEDT